MIRAILVAPGGLVLTVAAIAAGLWVGLQPPDALEVPPQGVVIANATVVNPGHARTPRQTVRVEGDRIASIAQTQTADASEARFRGRFVLPGLIDMHVHHPPGFDTALTELFGVLYLAHGVFACGNLIDGEPPFWPNSLVVQTADEAREDTLNPFVVPGASLHEELRLFVDAGLTPEEAWVAATQSPGEFLPEPDLGVIQPGAPADLLVFREDPSDD